MIKNFISFCLIFTSLSVSTVFAQETELFGVPLSEYQVNPENDLIRCASSEYEKHLQNNFEGYASEEEFEAWLAPKVAEMKQRLTNGEFKNELIQIPVVVHVIHAGQPEGVGMNISTARVQSQIDVLNQDFQKIEGTPGYNDHEFGASIGLNFCLAQVDPDGNPTNGINRVEITGTIWNEANVENVLKPTTQWDPTKYFNIWVCQFGGDLNGVLGYAQFPSNSGLGGMPVNGGAANRDGVIIDWRAFGDRNAVPGTYFNTYDRGRTTTHEIGHSFGLRHIWGDTSSCIVNTNDSFNDYCPDTPAANSANYSCVVIDSCPADPGNDMVENYMDYTNDACMNIYTLDQKARVLAVIENSPRRKELPNSNVCDALGVSDVENQEFTIYPNPAKDFLNVSVKNSQLTSYTIYNTLGQQVKRENLSGTQFKINVNNLKKGTYILTVYSEKGSSTHKFIKD
ncbi:T9SS type A sorting domain-containing protein [Moheibacter sp.]|uniref:T9SS type A sorting domain-containing protein n=1 Tax=Moheibacter sp. TaxID=1965316 RepID=UPI003C728CCA